MKALITGTSSGIGNGLAKAYLNKQYQVWGISRRIPEDLVSYPDYHHLSLDLVNHEQVKQQLPKFVADVSLFDIVILNSGILGKIQLTKDASIEAMKTVMEINVWSNKGLMDILFGMHINIKQLIGMSSGAALRSTPGWGSYSLSKAALDMLINVYAKERPETHFTAFAPGLVDSEIQEYIYNLQDAERYPSAKKLKEARYTASMPDADAAAPLLIKGFEKALIYDSGLHLDIREIFD